MRTDLETKVKCIVTKTKKNLKNKNKKAHNLNYQLISVGQSHVCITNSGLPSLVISSVNYFNFYFWNIILKIRIYKYHARFKCSIYYLLTNSVPCITQIRICSGLPTFQCVSFAHWFKTHDGITGVMLFSFNYFKNKLFNNFYNIYPSLVLIKNF